MNVEAFCTIYGTCICKTLNNRRTNSQGNLRKAYIARAMKGLKMPTPAQLKTIIYRNGLEMAAEEEIPGQDEENTGQQKKNPGDLSDEEGDGPPEDRPLTKPEVKQNQEWLDWYWSKLLPCIVGKYVWGYSIRNYVTITKGCVPGKGKKKYITSSDEALVLTLYENCEQRFPYAARIAMANEKQDIFCAEYQSRWTDEASGQMQFGGFADDGREWYVIHRNKIATQKRKPHVFGVESACLYRLQVLHSIKKPHNAYDGAPVSSGPAVKTCFFDLPSDDEQEVAGAVEKELGNFRKPREKKQKK